MNYVQQAQSQRMKSNDVKGDKQLEASQITGKSFSGHTDHRTLVSGINPA